MLIRKANKADLQGIVDLYSDVHTAEEQGRLTTGWVREIYPVAATAEEALSRDDIFVEEEDGKIVGTGIINQTQLGAYAEGDWQYDAEPEEVMVLHTLAIEPFVMHKGYGRRFMEFFEEYAAGRGCRYLRIDTNERNAGARAFYKRLGYAEVGVFPWNLGGIPGVRLVLLEKRI